MSTAAPCRPVAAYLRVSTDEQALGLAAQRSAIEHWAAAAGVHVAAWCVDEGVSGAAPLERRPGLVRALAIAGRKGVVVVARRDRLARDPLVAMTAERSVGAIVSADAATPDGPAGALVRGILDNVAAFERELIRARTRAALAAKASRGERTSGHAPLGWRVGADGIRLEPVPAELAALATMRELAVEGHGPCEIAARLDPAASRTGRWHARTVGRLLVRMAAASAG